MMATLRVPVTMASNNKKNNDFQKRIQKDSKKISKAFDKINKESEVRRNSWVEELDKLAKKDVQRIKDIFEDSDIEVTVDIDDDDFDTVDDVVVFKRNDV